MDGLIDFPATTRAELVDEAWAAIDGRNWDGALGIWALIRETYPDFPDGYVWPAHTTWLAGRLEEAETMASAALLRLPGNADALVLHAQLAVAREAWPEAVERWRRAHEAAHDRADVDAGLIAALRITSRLDEAERLAVEALRRHPDDSDLLIEHVWLAIARECWTEAATRAQNARRRLRALGQDSIQLGSAEYRIAMNCVVDAQSATIVRSSEPSSKETDLSVRDLMLSFESLGERCDFGLTQRHYGAEPFGLLRLAFAPYEALVAALNAEFDGVGGAETEFERRHGELVAKVDRYGLSFHTFTYENELGEARRHERFYLRWLRHLKDRLIADLRAGTKTFVYGAADGLSDHQVLNLFALLRRYGSGSLLCVRPAGAGHADGEVEVVRDGLYVAYLGRFAAFEAGEQPSFNSWRTICEKTHRMAHRLPAVAIEASPHRAAELRRVGRAASGDRNSDLEGVAQLSRDARAARGLPRW